MCGLNGFLRLRPEAPPADREEILRTRDSMAHRGPDGSGLWMAEDGSVALAHRRLAILDPSPAGAQPMTSADHRYRLILNGEIYNFRDLRAALEAEGEYFRSHSDTEVILALYARYGTAMLPRLRGMFALALWDSLEATLLLARDPYGIKPLYLSTAGGVLRFASQVRALEASGAISQVVDPAALAGFLLWGSVPEPRTIRREIRAVPAGSYLLARLDGGPLPDPIRFGGFDFEGLVPGEPPLPESAAEALTESVGAHLVSDVPVAVFLSAGLDSALIAALAQRARPADPLQSFTLRFASFADAPEDEGPLAAEVARTLGLRHRERTVGDEELRGLQNDWLAAMDQPSVDGANTFLVSRLAAGAGLKVVLSGLGGDEIFGSYPSFRDVPRWVQAARWGRLAPGAKAIGSSLARRLAPSRPKLAGLLHHGDSLAGAYFLRRGLFLPEELPRLVGRTLAADLLGEYDPVSEARRALGGETGPWRAVHRLESTLYLRNQLLRDADWASMAHSLELRVPLVDERLRRTLDALGFEPARTAGKATLVRRVAPELPAALFDRPKTGFTVPLGALAGRPAASRQGLDARRLALAVLRAGNLADVPEAI
jgi:asparagine synthase (glutamine-hydrolysing)